MNKRIETNPYGICSWKPISECKDCPITGQLKCRFNFSDLLGFIGLVSFPLIPAFVGMILVGNSWFLIGWFGLSIIFFGFWEIRILCRHCPYYAEKGFILHCIANYGCPKIWKYRPEPINVSEKIQLLIGFFGISSYPLPFLLFSGQFSLFLLTITGLIIFFWGLQNFICSKCVNFSCVLNRVSAVVVDEYLKRNPILKKHGKEKS